jgi:O-antigen/teichoic acid export membrane protein
LNNKAITFLKNFSYTLLSNLISILISTSIILIVPKLIGVEEYGYWQLYLFYSSYVGFLHFGWNDGIYLRFGGKDYNDLNKNLFFSQFWMLVIFQVLIGLAIIVISFVLSTDVNRLFIIKMTALCMLIVNVRLMLIYFLQCTNRIKEYAQITMLEKVLYCCLIIIFILVGITEFQILIFADIIGKFTSLVYSIYCCRDIVFKTFSSFYFNIRETFENINVGIKLMFANIASMLLVGIVRFGIEKTWDVSIFGKVSLTLSISNFMMVFINAVSIIMFPVLRRTHQVKLPNVYTTMRTFLIVPLLGLLLSYYPLKVILSNWLPQYSDSLLYMALLFPICVYEGKMALLINTYFKTLRKEKLMLAINLVSVVLSVILTIMFTIFLKNLSLVVVSIVIILAFRCVLAELFLSKILNIYVGKDIFLEMAMVIIFILLGWFTTLWGGIVLYLVAYCSYLLFKKNDIKLTLKNLNRLMKG